MLFFSSGLLKFPSNVCKFLQIDSNEDLFTDIFFKLFAFHKFFLCRQRVQTDNSANGLIRLFRCPDCLLTQQISLPFTSKIHSISSACSMPTIPVTPPSSSSGQSNGSFVVTGGAYTRILKYPSPDYGPLCVFITAISPVLSKTTETSLLRYGVFGISTASNFALTQLYFS